MPAGRTHNQLDAVCVPGVDLAALRPVRQKLRLVFNRGGIVFLRRPLAQVNRMRSPFQNPAAMEVVEVSPVAVYVLEVIRTPRTRTEPFVPVDFRGSRQGLCRQPVVIRRRPKRIGVNFQQFAEFSFSNQFRRQLEVADVAPLRSRLIDDSRPRDGNRQRNAFFNGKRQGLFTIDVFPVP